MVIRMLLMGWIDLFCDFWEKIGGRVSVFFGVLLLFVFCWYFGILVCDGVGVGIDWMS